jgi:hypothetical protein
MNITRIFDEFEKGNICVFNNISEARHSLIEYAMTGKSIEMKYAITIDTFKNYFVEDKGDKIKITPVMRLLFVDEFLKNNKLSYLISDRYPESIDRLSLYVSKLLPSLKRLKESSAYKLLDVKMISDVELLYTKYNEFLNDRNLYEANYDEYKYENCDSNLMDENYSIIASDTIQDLNRFYKSIGSPANISFISSLDDVGNINLESFENCAEEEAIQLRRIAFLLNDGVNVNDIAITLSDFNNQIEDIKREAKKFNIPISYKPVTPLKNYSECKYFYGLKNLYDERFSLSTMKEFFLDSGLNFKDKSSKRALIRIGIDANINHGQITDSNDTWCEKLTPKKIRKSQIELYASLIQFYNKFKTNVINLNRANTEEELKSCLDSLDSLLFEERDDSNIPSEVYKRIMREFEIYFDAMKSCKMKVQHMLFSHLIDFLNDVKYEGKENKEPSGIQIYSYPESGTLNYKYHFILGMNHAATETIFKPLDILPPSIDEEFREEESLTYPILNNYITSIGKTYISYSGENYSGSQLPPSFFIERNLSQKGRLDIPLIDNPYKAEELFYSKKVDSFKVVPLQMAGFKKANATVFTNTRFSMADKNMEDPEMIDLFLEASKNDKGEIKLSSTSIDTFKKCPYKWALKYVMKINDMDFDIVPLDHREVGTFLHKVMEVFFRRVKQEDKRFFSANLEKYEEMLSSIFDDELYAYSKGDKSPTPSALIYIKDAFKGKVMNILSNECENFDGLESYGFEKHLEYHSVLEGETFNIPYYIDGLIDRIVTLEEQGYAIIDYKKSNATIKEKAFRQGIEETGELKSYQFPCYRVLMNNNDMDAKKAAYYGFNDGKYEFVFQDDEDFLLKIDEIFSNVVKEMLLDIKNGNFKTTPSKSNCAGCSYRQICRKRYSTK